MTQQLMFLSIYLPVLAALALLLVKTSDRKLINVVVIAAAAAEFAIAVKLFGKQELYISEWGSFGFKIAFRLYDFSSFLLGAIAAFAVLISIFSAASLPQRVNLRTFAAGFLVTIGFANGVALANDLIVLLFFWEGLLCTLFAMIYVGHAGAYKTAIKAFVISGIADLCMMVGIGLTAHLAGTTLISAISLETSGPGGWAFVLLMIGAIAKAGAMPFHSWIPDAAVDAPLPFMAFLPAALEKLVGIYFLSRISFSLFKVQEHSWVSTMLMIIGAVTILLAVAMALIQKDFKRLLAFHAISQVGYMILGIGTAVPAGIVGGIFHMINNALYKSCLFLTGGAVEKQAGTTDLNKLGGLGRKMPLTFLGFFIAAVAISGVPPLNGFFSKELVYDGALERGWVFYAAALLGSVLTAASFLKLGHAAFCDKERSDISSVREAPAAMVAPILLIALLCILFGVYNALPLQSLIQPAVGAKILGSHDFSGWPHNNVLVILSLVAFAIAVGNHVLGVKRSGSGLKAVDHIHHAPVLRRLYDMAEKRFFDPYELAMAGFNVLARACWAIDRGIDWIYNKGVPQAALSCTKALRLCHNGNHAVYLIWLLVGLSIVVLSMVFA